MAEDNTGRQVWRGSWWRFERYELVGRRVRPVRGARLTTYDPWHDGDAAAGKQPLYVELGRLGEQVRDWHSETVKTSWDRFWTQAAGEVPAHPTSSEIVAWLGRAQAALAAEEVELPPELGEAILDWCKQFGLLGIFQHETLLVDLEAGPRALLAGFSESGEDAQLLTNVKRYERVGAGWREHDLVHRSALTGPPPEGLAVRSLAKVRAESVWPGNETRLGPEVVLRRHGLPGRRAPRTIELADLNELRRSYLRDRHGSGLPLPNSAAFWRAYSEDVVAIAGYAVCLADILRGVQSSDAKKRSAQIEALNELLECVSPVLRYVQGSFKAELAIPSLLGSLAVMAYRDISGGVRFASCKRCGQLYRSRRRKQRFCSLLCQDAAKKQKRRRERRARAS
jgi:hypothetical protein